MPKETPIEKGLGWAYDQITGDEDSRVCKDIPDEACQEQPRNFFGYLIANTANKIADELASARLTLPWLFSALGVPVAFTSFLVPVREAGVLIPQLMVAAYIRKMPRRNKVWLLGAGLSGLAMLVMALLADRLQGSQAGFWLLTMLVVYSLARGLCSVSAKDVLGKTVSKMRRGTLMGYSAAFAGVVTLLVGLSFQLFDQQTLTEQILINFLYIAALLWIVAIIAFWFIIEPAGASEGGGNAIQEAMRSLKLLINDLPFRQFVIMRIMLLSIALAPPFFVLLAQSNTDSSVAGLGLLIVASGLANSLSGPLWGRWSDFDSRFVMLIASLMAAGTGFLAVLAQYQSWLIIENIYWYTFLFFVLSLAHSGARLGRKVYLVDMATQETRAQYVAVSNTVIGVAMLVAGLIGVLGDIYGVLTVILVLSLFSLLASVYALRIRNVSG